MVALDPSLKTTTAWSTGLTDSPAALPDNTTRTLSIDGRALILVKHQGNLYLYENNCPHASETLDPMGGSLSNDTGDLVRCQRHGAEFLATSGECVGGPCLGEALTAVAFTPVGDEIYLD